MKKIDFKKTLHAALTLTMVGLFVLSLLLSSVSVVPWRECQHLQTLTWGWSLTVAVVVVWTVGRLKSRHFVQGGFGVVVVTLSVLPLFGVASSFSKLACGHGKKLERIDFPAACASARSAISSVLGDKPYTITEVFCYGVGRNSGQLGVLAVCPDHTELHGSSNGNGPWSIQRRPRKLSAMPTNDIENVFASIARNDPTVISNAHLEVHWDINDRCWRAEGDSAEYLVNDDLSGFRQWSR